MNEVEENSINIRELFGILRKRIKLIVFFVVLTTAIGAAYTFFVAKPVYQASTQLVVKLPETDTGNGTNVGAASGNVLLVNTINQFIVSSFVLEQVQKNLNLNESVEALQQSVTASSATNSFFININVQNQNANLAKKIVDEIANVISKDAPERMNVANVNALPSASDPLQVGPNKKLYLVVSLLAGFLIGCGLALLFELMDNTINSEEDMERILGKPLLGIVPLIEGSNSIGSGTTLASKSSGRNGKNNRRRR
ncbi:YveK family protein [Lactovum odontotermitis]